MNVAHNSFLFCLRLMCRIFKKITIPPQGRFMEIQGAGRLLKHNFFEGRYDAKLEFLEGWGRGGSILENTFCGRGMDIFWNNAIELGMIFQAWDINVLAVHFFKVTLHCIFHCV